MLDKIFKQKMQKNQGDFERASFFAERFSNEAILPFSKSYKYFFYLLLIIFKKCVKIIVKNVEVLI